MGKGVNAYDNKEQQPQTKEQHGGEGCTQKGGDKPIGGQKAENKAQRVQQPQVGCRFQEEEQQKEGTLDEQLLER